jgi:predicted metal-dependent phosphoesterase TrpH
MSSHVGTNGFLAVTADLHTHAIGDGRYDAGTSDRVERHLEGALAAGLRVVGVTDHDDLRPGMLARELAEQRGLPLLVLAGMEVTTGDGHLVALGLTEPLAPWRPMTETIAAARAQGALCILPHPFFPHLRERDDVDAIERLNFRYGDFDVAREDIAVIASSDAHSPGDLRDNPHRTLLHVEYLSWEGIAGAIHARQVSIEQRDG